MSGGLGLQRISDAMKNDPNFSPYYANRQIKTSVRAGNPAIYDQSLSSVHDNYYNVSGIHHAVDAVAGTLARRPDSETFDCNLANWDIAIFDR